MTTTTTPPRVHAPVPAATRHRRPAWRNPRLLLGLALVAASVLLGARVVAAADDTVAVWALTRDLPAGTVPVEGDLEPRQVRFPDTATADAYLSADDDLADDLALDRPLGAGELLPRSALRSGSGPQLTEVPLSVEGDDLPATVEQGSVVDVWVSPRVATTGTARPEAVRVLDDVVVVAVPRRADTLAPQSTRQVIVGVPAERAATLGAALGGMADGRVVVARVG